MEIDQLRYFLKVAECESFTKASIALMVSQPALSRSIQKLEAELERPLFERHTKSVSLTEAGVLMQARARQILQIIDDTRSEIVDDSSQGTLRVAAIPTIAPYFLPRVLQEFAKRFPKAHVLVQEDTTDHLLKKCTQGEIDVAFLSLPINSKYLEVNELFEEELFLVLASDHPLAAKKSISMQDIEQLPFVLLDEAHCLTDSIVSFCRQKSVQPISVERTSQLATVQELVALAHGISLVPEMAMRIDKSKNRVYRSFAGDKPTRKIAILSNPYRFQSKLQQSFLAFCKGMSFTKKL